MEKLELGQMDFWCMLWPLINLFLEEYMKIGRGTIIVTPPLKKVKSSSSYLTNIVSNE